MNIDTPTVPALIDDELEVRRAFEPHYNANGARFMRPMHVRLLRRRG